MQNNSIHYDTYKQEPVLYSWRYDQRKMLGYLKELSLTKEIVRLYHEYMKVIPDGIAEKVVAPLSVQEMMYLQ